MKTIAELQALRDEMKGKVGVRREGEYRTKILVGMATCGIAAGARPVLAECVKEIETRKLKDVYVGQTGCIGICQFEPVVEIYDEDGTKTTYVHMTADKVQANIDGTGLLEEISAAVLRCYLGYHRARSVVFGTATGGSFRDKVDELCIALGEGGCFDALDAGPVNANDDRLDSVAWIPFSDKRRGQLIIFCQCKTGTSWKEHTTQLQPDAFIKRWMQHRAFLVVPVRAFCVSESTCPTAWGGLVSYAGLLFDRLRLVDFLDRIEPDLLDRIRTWNGAAAEVAAKAMN